MEGISKVVVDDQKVKTLVLLEDNAVQLIYMYPFNIICVVIKEEHHSHKVQTVDYAERASPSGHKFGSPFVHSGT